MAEVHNALSDASGLLPKDVKSFLEALQDIVAKGLRENNVFKLHGIALIRMKKTSARPASTKLIFGRKVPLPARPEREKITCVAVKPLYEAVRSPVAE